MTKYLFVFWLLVVSFKSSFGQYQNWKLYSSQDEIHCMTLQGNYLWLGSTSGLTRYDKTTGQYVIFTKENSGLPSVEIRCLTTDNLGNLWIAAGSKDLVKFDGTTWTTFNTLNSPVQFSKIECLFVDKNNKIWVGSGKGLESFDGTNWQFIDRYTINPAGSGVYRMVIDSNGVIYASVFLNGLSVFNGINWTNYNRNNSNISNDIIEGMVIDHNNILWMGSQVCNGSGGLMKFDGNGFTSYQAGIQINYLAVDDSNYIWYPTYYGINKFQSGIVTTFNSNNSQITPDISPFNCLLQDGGKLWYSTLPGKGIHHFDGHSIVQQYSFTNTNLPFNSISEIKSTSNDDAWFAFSINPSIFSPQFIGVGKLSQNNFTYYNTNNSGLPYDDVESMAIDRFDNVWMGTYKHGLIKYNGNSFALFDSSTGLPGNAVYGRNEIAFDSYDDVWVAVKPRYDNYGQSYGGGLVMYDGYNWTNIPTPPILSNSIQSLIIDSQDQVWLGSQNKISKLSGSTWKNFNFPFGTVEDICSLNNTVYASAYGDGIIQILNDSITVFTETNSLLPSNDISGIEPDENGNLWITYNDFDSELYVLSVFDGNSFQNFTLYNSGIACNNVNDIYIRNHKIYLSSECGLQVFDESLILTLKEETNSTENFAVNYSNGKLMILSNSHFNTNVTIDIIDTQGREMYKGNLSDETNIDYLSYGLYIVNLYEGQRMIGSKKFVKM